MGKVIAVEYVTLDGVFEDPAWSGPYFGKELEEWQWGNLREADSMLLGRKTYEAFKSVWPNNPADFFTDRMNSIPKHVATTTLTEPEWAASFIEGDVAEAVAKLKTESGSMLLNGSADLLNYLTAHRLVDEYRIMVYPVVVGTGRKLWADGTRIDLKLTNSHITETGVAVLTYVPA